MIQAVSESAAAQDLSRFFDHSVAEQITNADHSVKSGEGVKRQAAVLFTDIRGFTPTAMTMEASDVVCMLSEYQKAIVPIIQKHGGSIDKFIGDGIMASFGAVAESDTYARDALRAVDDIIVETNSWVNNDKLKMIAGPKINVAVAAGPVIFGVIGGDDRLEYTTIGDAVNLSAKLEKCNKETKSRALTDQATLAIAEKQGYEKPAPAQEMTKFVESVGEELDLCVMYPI